MFFERGPQLLRIDGPRHFRQGLENLLFRVKYIFQFMDKQVFQTAEAHRFSLSSSDYFDVFGAAWRPDRQRGIHAINGASVA
jgi:hypothetical protein